jgi:hypothetical protein
VIQSEVMIAMAIVGFNPAPESGPAIRTQTKIAMATVRFESIPSVVALTRLYLTKSTVDTSTAVKKASTRRRYSRNEKLVLPVS